MADTTTATTEGAPAKRRIALTSNCLANQNAKVDEYALCAGMVVPVVQLLRELGFTIQQMPCPELSLLGPNRWWQTKEMYDTAGFRKHCQKIAKTVADVLEPRVDENVLDIVVLGVDGSPSSGVNVTMTSRGKTSGQWGGRPDDTGFTFIPGKGVWMEELEAELRSRNLPPVKFIGVPMELPEFELNRIVTNLRAELEAVISETADA